MPVDPGTARELIHRVFDLQRVVRCLSTSELKHGELGVASQGVLRVIGEHGGRAVDLAGKLGVSAPVLSRHLAELEGLELVARHRDPEDRRAQLVGLTDRGRTVLEEIEEHRISRLQGYLADWDEERATAAVAAIGQLSEALRSGSGHPRSTSTTPTTTESEEALAAR